MMYERKVLTPTRYGANEYWTLQLWQFLSIEGARPQNVKECRNKIQRHWDSMHSRILKERDQMILHAQYRVGADNRHGVQLAINI